MQKVEFAQEPWDKKKIVSAILIIVLLIAVVFGVKIFFLDANKQLDVSNTSAVRGVQTQENPSLSLPSAQNIESGIAKNLDNIKAEISKLNVADIASSSPQIQKIVNDIKSLPSVPRQQACLSLKKICDGL